MSAMRDAIAAELDNAVRNMQALAADGRVTVVAPWAAAED